MRNSVTTQHHCPSTAGAFPSGQIREQTMEDVKEALRQFILSAYLPGESRKNLRDDTPLVTSGILDSLAALGLANFVEQRFSIELDVYEMSAERFDRIKDIAATVLRKQTLLAQPSGGRER